MSHEELSHIPLFPLNTVLFPGGVLPLRIFEPRYLEMVGQCLRTGSGFGVVAIQDGREAGKTARFQPVGTLARIVDFDRLDDGMLGITCRGEQRLRVVSQWVQPDQLLIAQVEWLGEDFDIRPLPTHQVLVDFLEMILNRADVTEYIRWLTMDWDSAAWIGYRLAELLPLPLPVKQVLLEMGDPEQRLDLLRLAFQSQ